VSRARFIAAARLEFLAEVIYYSEAQAGLGKRFAAAVVVLLLIYAKSKTDNITGAKLKEIRRVIEN
jgi:hypothetical protein